MNTLNNAKTFKTIQREENKNKEVFKLMKKILNL
jgi:hypothetical protein